MQVGNYQVLEELARGSTSTVYRAFAPRLGREVALKLAHQTTDPDRFAREVESLRALDHVLIPGLLDRGEHLGRGFLVQELIAGPTLAGRVAERGPLRPGQAAQMLRKLAEAIAHAHERGVVHGDLKAECVVLEGGEPRLVGFRGRGAEADDVRGLSGVLDAALAGSTRVDPGLAALSESCSGDADSRPSAAELARSLEEFLEVGSSEERRLELGARPRGLTGALIAVLGLLLLVAGALAVVLVQRRQGPEVATPTPTAAPSPTPSATAAPEAGPLERARAHREAGRLAEAEEVLDRAIDRDPRAPLLHERGEVRLARGRIIDAQADLRRALALSPERIEARRALADALIQGERWEDARLQLAVVLRKRPNDPEVWRWWGWASLERVKWGDALHGLRKSLELRPDPRTHAELARLYVRGKRLDKALAALQRGLEVRPLPALRAQRICVAIRAGDLVLAGQDLAQLPDDASTPVDLDAACEEVYGRLLDASLDWSPKERTAALTCLRGLSARFPKAAGPLSLLGALHLLRGEVPAARSALKLSLDRDAKARSAAQLGLTQVVAGDQPDRAIENFRVAGAAQREDKTWGLPVALARGLAGDPRQARVQGVSFLTRQRKTPLRALGAAALMSLAGEQEQARQVLTSTGLQRLIATIPQPGEQDRVRRLYELMICGWAPLIYPTARLRDVLDKHRTDAWLLAWAGPAARGYGQPHELTLALLKAAQAALPESSLLSFQVCVELVDQGELDAARRAIAKARERWPRLPNLLMLLGRVEGEANRPEAIEAAYREAFSLQRHPMIANNLANTLLLKGEHEEGLELARYAASKLKTESAVLETLAWALTLSGKLEEARGVMIRALTIDPSTAAGWAHYANLLVRLGEREQAQRILAVAEVVTDPRGAPVNRREAERAIRETKQRLEQVR